MPHASGSSGARVTARSRRSARRPERGLPGRAILTPAMPAPQRRRKSAGCAESLLPATPQAAVGPLSSKSTVPTLRRRLRSFLTPAKTVRVCLRCQTSRASARLSSAPQPGPSAESTALTLRPGRFDCRCHFSSLQLRLAISYYKSPTLQFSVSNRLQQLASAGPAANFERPAAAESAHWHNRDSDMTPQLPSWLDIIII